MPNLRTWIEAQLKRGYSRKQIKDSIIGKGYSPKVVAEVDKISYSAELQSKKIRELLRVSLCAQPVASSA